MTYRSAFLLFALLTSSGIAPSQVWIQLFPAQRPDREVGTSLVLDHSTQTPMGFSPGQSFTLDTVWTWDGSDWNTTPVGNSPFARPSADYVDDIGANRIRVAGGFAGDSATNYWSFDGSSWTITPSGPGLLGDPAMAYDGVRMKVLLFGGSGLMGATSETWVIDGTFQQLMPTTTPPARFLHKLVYDSKRQRIVMFGGSSDGIVSMGETWEWDGIDWSQVMTAHSPGPRFKHAMAYDPDREVVVLHGGMSDLTTQLGDTWEYDGTDWAKTSDSGPDSFSAHRMVYEPAAKRMLLVNESRQTWVYVGVQAASYDAFGEGCPGSLGLGALSAVGGGLPTIGNGFDIQATNITSNSSRVELVFGFSDQMFGNQPLPLDLGFLGLWNCKAFVSVFTSVPMDRNGTMARFTLDIPNDPSLLGLEFFNQALVEDPGAPNPVGFIVTNAAKGVIGS